MQTPLDLELARCEAQTTASLALAWELLGAAERLAAPLAELGDIQLPPAAPGASDPARMRMVASLYVAAELEPTRLLDAVEMFSRLYVAGAVPMDLGNASERVVSFWRRRHERFSAQERQALFSHVFGGGYTAAGPVGTSNQAFETLLFELAVALHRLHRSMTAAGHSQADHLARVHAAAQRLIANVAARNIRWAVSVAPDLLDTLQRALDVLRLTAVQAAVQADGVWSAVATLARRYLHAETPIVPRVTRAWTGAKILAWLADIAPDLDRGSEPLIRHESSAPAAASEWLRATADLEEGYGLAGS